MDAAILMSMDDKASVSTKAKSNFALTPVAGKAWNERKHHRAKRKTAREKIIILLTSQ
jgi:hypothetical protein